MGIKFSVKILISAMALSALISTAIIVNGCALYQKPSIPNLQVPASFRNANKFIATNNMPASANFYATKWWQTFNDEKLNQLVEHALQNNLNYQIALKNIQIARTYVEENASALFPQINLNYGISRNAPSANAITPANRSSNNSGNNNNQIYNLYQLNGSVSYEVDVWHRVGNSIKQAAANANISAADSDIIKLALTAAVVDAYFQIAAVNSNLQNLRQQYAATNEILSINKTQYKGGLVNVEAIDNAKIQATAIQANINNLIKQQQILRNTLAYLSGEYPEKFNLANNAQNGRRDNVNFEKIVPTGLPAQMLRNRPDIQKAFYGVLSYGYAEKQSLASFFPTFTLTTTYGFASTSLSNFTSGGSLLWNFGANILQPLFDWGKRASQYRRAKLQYEAAILGYKNTVINAFQEVNNALVTYQQDYLTLKVARQTLTATGEKTESARAQYRAGMFDYATYLSYKLSFLQSQYSVTNQNQTLISDVIQLYKALGVGV